VSLDCRDNDRTIGPFFRCRPTTKRRCQARRCREPHAATNANQRAARACVEHRVEPRRPRSRDGADFVGSNALFGIAFGFNNTARGSSSGCTGRLVASACPLSFFVLIADCPQRMLNAALSREGRGFVTARTSSDQTRCWTSPLSTTQRLAPTLETRRVIWAATSAPALTGLNPICPQRMSNTGITREGHIDEAAGAERPRP
jgi:hypothetical protein